MLNYIWAGLIVFSLLFALVADVGDLTRDTYRNGAPVPLALQFDGGYDAEAPRQPVTVRFDAEELTRFYGTDEPIAVADSLPGTLIQTAAGGREVRIAPDAALPDLLATIRDETNPRDQVLQGSVPRDALAGAASPTVATAITFAPVRFVKMRAISSAALDFAETAVEIALGLIGVLALFLGLMKIAEEAGVVYALVKLVRPLLRPLFPNIPEGHPAMGMIALNLAANIFGLGNAATPFGIKAMEELQKLNPEPDTATDEMAMLLAMNTASVQLVPPVILIALIGLEINEVYFAIVFTTALSLTVAILTAKGLSTLKRYRETNPRRLGDAPATASPAE
ncbi:MAG TPA: nucleoside recognition protein [Bacteroidetes bacterium]|nr:nucleoside recognition protein [Bacteroidota bacterium]